MAIGPSEHTRYSPRLLFSPTGLAMQFARSRRRFVRETLLASATIGAGVHQQTAAQPGNTPSAKLNLAAIGVWSRGQENLLAVRHENIVALCDVDARYLARVGELYPQARRYQDFRELFEREKELDGVLVNTPDHTHFHPVMRALQQGIHVYCEKPLAHNVREVREIARAARDSRSITQMGNQHHSSAGYHQARDLVQNGDLGEIREVHSWTNRPIWPQGIPRQKPIPVPPELAWKLWLGPAVERPYTEFYHPLKWRGWWDFGTGALGDMGPHLIDPAFWALDLKSPVEVRGTSSGVNTETGPLSSRIQFTFAARGPRPPVQLTWYDGNEVPDQSVTSVKRPPGNGTMLLGSRARLFIPQLGGKPIALPREKGDRIKLPAPPDESPRHEQRWLDACKGGPATNSDFQYAAALSETCLLGNVVLRTGKPIRWNAMEGKTDQSAADVWLGRQYRQGWEW
ncbi:MAG: Gfo/Idh/MocA family oxidoreductase [Planctomycetota bacterium]|nr:Gfo/Idh/MocA family oxidoreductase [Planctomycetota bacterium]